MPGHSHRISRRPSTGLRRALVELPLEEFISSPIEERDDEEGDHVANRNQSPNTATSSQSSSAESDNNPLELANLPTTKVRETEATGSCIASSSCDFVTELDKLLLRIPIQEQSASQPRSKRGLSLITEHRRESETSELVDRGSSILLLDCAQQSAKQPHYKGL